MLEDTKLIGLAEKYSTPLYVYDLDGMLARAIQVKSLLGPGIELLYAVKANPNPEVVRGFLGNADGLDISSGGEYRLAVDSGWDPARLSFAGPGKTMAELELAVGTGCGSISVESDDDLDRILEASRRVGRKPRIALRINPRELPGQYALRMGGRPTQFGVDEEDAARALETIAGFVSRGEAIYAGLHVYAGTQCLDAATLIENVKNTLRIAEELEVSSALAAPCVNLGGGFGLAYHEGQVELDAAAACAGIAAAVDLFKRSRPGTVIRVELGRYLVGPSGWYLSRVLAVKRSRGKVYCVLDGGMHQNLSASGNLGQTIKRNYPIRKLGGADTQPLVQELAGSLCTPVDIVGFGLSLPELRVGDLVCFDLSGAYGFSASPLFFLGHDTAREIAVERGRDHIAREAISLAGFNDATQARCTGERTNV